MRPTFEELDYRPTPIGALSLRRRHDLRLGEDVLEIKLGDAFLMSSRFTASEIALARLGLAEVSAAAPDVVVGGLGLGYTAAAVLEDARVASLLVVDMLEPVIDWHRTGLLPLGSTLTGDDRCRLVCADFFALAASADGFDPDRPGRPMDAILVDIDHAPGDLLDSGSAGFYTPDGLAALARHLKPGGVFGLWSNEAPDPAFTDRLSGAFANARAEPVVFDNPYLGDTVTQTVYLARTDA
ncbi:spermidine synthase [Thalassobaculum sp.]|uniref:spermidine synthase n=1 Tax=Thalassobaculum sp. TaxID=2022740 RepID=UPI0032EADC18